MGSNYSLIAEIIVIYEEFLRAIIDGYSYFQVEFFSRPSIIHGLEIPPNQAMYIQLLSAISRSPSDLGEIERLVLAEASLCYRGLRMVNSASLGIRGHRTSIRPSLFLIRDGQPPTTAAVAMRAHFGQ